MVARTADDYAGQLLALLPTGPAWPRDREASFGELFTGMAQEMARLDARIDALLEEADPRTAFEMITDWEHLLGLPDPCTAAATTLSARQVLAWRKLAYQAGQTKAFYIALAASLGIEIEIHEFDPDVDDHDPSLTPFIAGGKYRYVWRVHVLTQTDYTVFRAGAGSAGDPLVEGDSLDIECVITNAKPAHTHVIFTYEEA